MRGEPVSARQAGAWERLEGLLVVLIAAHTFAVGAFLLFFTAWGVEFGGWREVSPYFFARQAGIFHFLLGTAYLLEYFRRGSITLLLLAKATAVVFLFSMTAVEPAPWAVPLSAVGDGLMGAAAFAVHRLARRG